MIINENKVLIMKRMINVFNRIYYCDKFSMIIECFVDELSTTKMISA